MKLDISSLVYILNLHVLKFCSMGCIQRCDHLQFYEMSVMSEKRYKIEISWADPGGGRSGRPPSPFSADLAAART